MTHSFTLTVPCPATGETGHRCPGFIRDHFIPLCADGADAVGNLWWEGAARAAEKGRRELQLGHRLRAIERHGNDPALRQRAMALYLRDVEAMSGDDAAATGRQAFWRAAASTIQAVSPAFAIGQSPVLSPHGNPYFSGPRGDDDGRRNRVAGLRA